MTAGISEAYEGDRFTRDLAPRGPEPGGRNGVAADMERIFSLLSPPITMPEAVAPDRAAIVGRPKARRWLILLLAGLVIVAFLSVAFAAFRIRTIDQAARPAPIRLQSPTPAPVRVMPPPVAAPVTPRARPVVAPTAPRAVRPRPQEDRKPKAAQPHASAEKAPVAPAQSPAQCVAGGGSEAWCLRTQSSAADDQLREAYQAAMRAGVDRRTLVGINKKWVRLRKRALKEPEALISGYAALTQELQRATGLVASH